MKTIAATMALLLAASPLAAADRSPTQAERTAVERVLRAGGFVSWEEIELDDDGPHWDVDDARIANGTRYDVKIDPRSMRIVRRQIDR